jgi:hypothetical protein
MTSKEIYNILELGKEYARIHDITYYDKTTPSEKHSDTEFKSKRGNPYFFMKIMVRTTNTSTCPDMVVTIVSHEETYGKTLDSLNKYSEIKSCSYLYIIGFINSVFVHRYGFPDNSIKIK